MRWAALSAPGRPKRELLPPGGTAQSAKGVPSGTFVSVGNATQPFARLLDAVAAIAGELPQPVFVQFGSTPFRSADCDSAQWLAMADFEQRAAQAQLLILHAGAGSVIHAIRAGRLPVVMPRRARYGEHVDDHQVEFARTLAEAGRVVLALEPGDLTAAVAEAMERQNASRPSQAPPPLVAMIDEVLRECAGSLRK